jgi:hypothetical protein
MTTSGRTDEPGPHPLELAGVAEDGGPLKERLALTITAFRKITAPT